MALISQIKLSNTTYDIGAWEIRGNASSSAVPLTNPGDGRIKYYYNVNNGLTGNMPTTNNANGILHLNTHGGEYSHQLGFSSDGNVYQRATNGTALSSSVAWKKILNSSNYTDYTVTKTGGGASGTWGINITGSAGSVAWGNITGKPSTFTPSSHTHSISQVTNLQANLDDKAGGNNYIDIVVGGDANTYYPVVLSNVSSYYPMQLVNISRRYNEAAPDTWNTATHRGGLTMTLFWNGSRYWDGNSAGTACFCVYKNETYSTMVGGLGNATSGIVVWLRGGSAYYHIHSLNGATMSATIYLSSFTDSAGNSFAPKTSPSSVTVQWPGAWMHGNAVTGAVWNDYAECRESNSNEPGYVLIENGDDTLSKSTKRLQQFAGISSDTWGFSQGETDKAKTHIAVAGRVLAYTYKDRNEYKPGDAVCTAPGGTVDIMTEEEIIKYPHRIVGTVSCVPDYEEWGGGQNADRPPVKVNGRIWIKVK